MVQVTPFCTLRRFRCLAGPRRQRVEEAEGQGRSAARRERLSARVPCLIRPPWSAVGCAPPFRCHMPSRASLPRLLGASPCHPSVTPSPHHAPQRCDRRCDLCPAAFHLKCIGMSEADSSSWGTWACPHHSCATCGRKAAAAGGLLFRCAVCVHAFCEDHLPPEALIMGKCERFQALGHEVRRHRTCRAQTRGSRCVVWRASTHCALDACVRQRKHGPTSLARWPKH